MATRGGPSSGGAEAFEPSTTGLGLAGEPCLSGSMSKCLPLPVPHMVHGLSGVCFQCT